MTKTGHRGLLKVVPSRHENIYSYSMLEILIILPYNQSDEIDIINLSERRQRGTGGRPLGDGMKG